MLIPHKPSQNLHSKAGRALRRADDVSDVHVTVIPWLGSKKEGGVQGRSGKRSGRAAALNRQPPP